MQFERIRIHTCFSVTGTNLETVTSRSKITLLLSAYNKTVIQQRQNILTKMNLRRIDKVNRGKVLQSQEPEGIVMQRVLYEEELYGKYSCLFRYEYFPLEYQHKGKGDMLFCDWKFREFAVVECKHLNYRSTGRNQRHYRRRARKTVQGQALNYLEKVGEMLSKDYGIKDPLIKAYACYNGKNGELKMQEIRGGKNGELEIQEVVNISKPSQQDNNGWFSFLGKVAVATVAVVTVAVVAVGRSTTNVTNVETKEEIVCKKENKATKDQRHKI